MNYVQNKDAPKQLARHKARTKTNLKKEKNCRRFSGHDPEHEPITNNSINDELLLCFAKLLNLVLRTHSIPKFGSFYLILQSVEYFLSRSKLVNNAAKTGNIAIP